MSQPCDIPQTHDDVIKWKHFPRYWPFVRGIHRSPVNSPHKHQWRRALMFSLICTWINDWVNNGETSDFRCQCAHHDVTVMFCHSRWIWVFLLWSISPCKSGNRHWALDKHGMFSLKRHYSKWSTRQCEIYYPFMSQHWFIVTVSPHEIRGVSNHRHLVHTDI